MLKQCLATMSALLLAASRGAVGEEQAAAFPQPPAQGGVCYDYVLERLGQPDRGGKNYRGVPDLARVLQSLNYRQGNPADTLQPGEVVQWGTSHVGIVGTDGKIHHYTQAAPALFIDAAVNVNDSIDDVCNLTRTLPGENGGTVRVQPFKNIPVIVWIPPVDGRGSSSTAMLPEWIVKTLKDAKPGTGPDVQPQSSEANTNSISPPGPRAGIYEGCISGRKSGAEELEVVRSSRVVLELKNGKPGSYDGTGAIFNMATEPPTSMNDLKAGYGDLSGEFFCDILDSFLMDGSSACEVRGGFKTNSSGDEYIEAKTKSGPGGAEMEMTLWRQDHGPEKVSQGAIIIGVSSLDASETTPGKTLTLHFDFRARDIIETPFKFDEKLTVIGPDGAKAIFSGGTQQLDYQHGLRGPGSMDAHGNRVCQLPALTKPGQYVCHIELTAPGYTKAAERDVTFRILETKSGGSATNAPAADDFGAALANEGHEMSPELQALFKKGFEARNAGGATNTSDKAATNDTPASLVIRMAAPLLELIPGDIGQIDGVYVGGWKRNSSDRVEVDLGVVDVGGDLKVNHRINAAPGDTSAMSFNMDGPEYYFSEIWTAKIGARPGLTRVPVIVRQDGSSAGIFLNVWILPRNTRLTPTNAAPLFTKKTSAAPGTRAAAASAEVDLQPANDLFKQQRFTEALLVLNPIVAAHPELRSALFLRGRVRMWLNDLRGAREDFLLLGVRDPTDDESQRRILEMDLLNSDRRAVLPRAEALAKMHPTNAMVQLVFAHAAAVNQDMDTARRIYAEVAAKMPDLAGRLFDEGRQLQQNGVPLMALHSYENALWLKPSDHRIYLGIGSVYAGLGERDKAADAYQRLLKLEPAGDLAERARQELNKLLLP